MRDKYHKRRRYVCKLIFNDKLNNFFFLNSIYANTRYFLVQIVRLYKAFQVFECIDDSFFLIQKYAICILKLYTIFRQSLQKKSNKVLLFSFKYINLNNKNVLYIIIFKLLTRARLKFVEFYIIQQLYEDNICSYYVQCSKDVINISNHFHSMFVYLFYLFLSPCSALSLYYCIISVIFVFISKLNKYTYIV